MGEGGINFYLPLSNSKRRKFQGVRVYDSVVGSDQVESLVAEVSMKPRERGGGRDREGKY